MDMQTKHYAILAALLVTIGAQIGSLQHGWSDALTPAFVGSTLGVIGTTLAALFVGSPTAAKD